MCSLHLKFKKNIFELLYGEYHTTCKISLCYSNFSLVLLAFYNTISNSKSVCSSLIPSTSIFQPLRLSVLPLASGVVRRPVPPGYFLQPCAIENLHLGVAKQVSVAVGWVKIKILLMAQLKGLTAKFKLM